MDAVRKYYIITDKGKATILELDKTWDNLNNTIKELHKPSKCPCCHESWIQDPLLEIEKRH